ncbi:MAG: large conductance mechanosensitive channel protein MscL [Christensenellales bacterium]|jgi:large conductance mechanosensitive channel protein
MKKFFKEFKTFISRGNIVDMAVGVIIGGAFTAIVTALTQQIFQPLVNWALAGAGGGLEEAVTMLKVVTDETGAVDMTKSIYIDWGAFITAVLNFFIVALVLFFILKTINRVHEAAKPKFYGYEKKEYYKMRASGLSKSEIEEMAAIRDKEAAEKAAAEAAAAVPPETQEDILRDIRELLKSASGNKSDEEKSKD